MWKDATGAIHALPNACPHMGAMLSEGWCEAQSDGTSAVVCPFHALQFDAAGCTVLPGGSGKKTLPQLQPLELIIQGDFIWSYGGYEPKIAIPTVLNEIAEQYYFVGHTGDRSIETDLLTMLLNMHDYNHQNGTHRDLFRITEVEFHQFVDEGTSFPCVSTTCNCTPYSLTEKRRKPDYTESVFAQLHHRKHHLKTTFPPCSFFMVRCAFGRAAQCHFVFLRTEAAHRTLTLIFAASISDHTANFNEHIPATFRVTLLYRARQLSPVCKDLVCSNQSATF
jgi:phenylpropionate dioxygenase-like ring-hydroxylating dioxygenase large terminal subunit